MFCNSLKKGALYVLGHVLKGDFKECLPELRRQQISWLKLVDMSGIKSFVDVVIANDEREGARNLILSCGLGGMRPNVVVMGFPTDMQNPARLYSNQVTQFSSTTSPPSDSNGNTPSAPASPLLNQGIKRDESEITIRAATEAIGRQKHRVLNLKALPTDSARRETPIKPTTYVGECTNDLILEVPERCFTGLTSSLPFLRYHGRHARSQQGSGHRLRLRHDESSSLLRNLVFFLLRW